MTRVLPWLACLAAAVASACDRAPPDSTPNPSPLRVLSTDPRPQAREVPLEQSLRIRVSRILRPTSVIRQSIRVTPGVLPEDGGDLPAGVVFFEPRWDPYDRVVTFEMQPGYRWIPSTLYSATLLVPEDDTAIAGLRAFDGVALAEPLSFAFMPGESVSDPAHDVDDVWPTVTYCDGAPQAALPAAREVLSGACGGSGCHQRTATSAPAMGLDLASIAGLRATAIRVAARQTMTSAVPGPPVQNPTIFGDGMALIDPGNPGGSYLVFKLIVNAASYANAPESDANLAPWIGHLQQDTAVPSEEIARLRNAFVRGEPMPSAGRLQPQAVRSIIAWIASGADLVECP